jgi:hypothetical protein
LRDGSSLLAKFFFEAIISISIYIINFLQQTKNTFNSIFIFSSHPVIIPAMYYMLVLTYGYEVEDIDAWPSKLSEKLRCRVRNYGVVGYGTDQAYLRYQHQSSKYSKIVVLNHLSEDILRNINQFNNLLYPNAEFALKPRFIIANNQLSLIQTISLSKLEFKEF